MKNEWGFDKFIRLIDFEQPTNGFLVNDTSFFGVEVFVTESSRLGECLSISEVPNISGFPNISGKIEWVISQFSKLGEECFSDEFIIGGHKWYLCIILDPFINISSLCLFLSNFIFLISSGSYTFIPKAIQIIKVSVFLCFWCLLIPKVPCLITK